MSAYKDTVNLPRTAFPMKANLAQREPEILHHWQQLQLYKKLQAVGQGKPRYILHDGPPYANGNIHIGHAVNKVLKDIVVKSHIMLGFNSPYIPGWDCHGLPIEHVVEKKYGKAGVKLSPKEFRDQCRQYAYEQMQIQRDAFIRLGVLGDWEHPFLTMDPLYEANVIRSFAQIVANGHLVKGRKPVHWCFDCGSALAEAEVEYKDRTSPAIDVRFEVLDTEALLSRCHHNPNHAGLGEGFIYVPIWTTTPWTLPANQAVTFNPSMEYAVVQTYKDGHAERLLLANDLLTEVMARYEINDYRVVAYARGDALEGVKLRHPFYEKTVPIILGEHVTTDVGTGAVHTAPAHGPDDYVVAIKYDLEIMNPVDGRGIFIENTEALAGMHVHKANDHIIELIKAKGMLIAEQRITHSYPHCWRHKTPLIFRATPQWFISLDKENLRGESMEAIFQINWVPESGRSRIAAMVGNRPDWCISRQRSWGVPMPLFIHKKTEDLHPNTIELMEKVALLVEKDGIEAWFSLNPEILLGAENVDYDKSNDVLEVWFESGVSHQCVLQQRPELSYPADIYLEGSDQHRGWFQSSLLTAIAMGEMAPYKTAVTHGFTVDAEGRKMSKSLGNVVAPDEVVKSLGADILRLWVASTDYSSEMSVSEEILKRTADTYRRLRNTARYLLANLYDFDPEKHLVPANAMLSLDRWAVDQARLLQEEVKKAYDTFQFLNIYQRVHHFCSIEMGSFYLDVIKDRQYTTKTDSLARRSAQTAMFHIIEGLVRWLAPILSFTAEEIWQHMPGKREASVFLSQWYENFLSLNSTDPFSQLYWQQIIQVRNCVNKELEKQRNLGKIRAPLDAIVTLYCEPPIEKKLNQLANELRFVFITSGARVENYLSAPEAAVTTDLPGLKVLVLPSDDEKCVRCWHRRADVGKRADYPGLCGRCIENIAGDGEIRQFL